MKLNPEMILEIVDEIHRLLASRGLSPHECAMVASQLLVEIAWNAGLTEAQMQVNVSIMLEAFNLANKREVKNDPTKH